MCQFWTVAISRFKWRMLTSFFTSIFINFFSFTSHGYHLFFGLHKEHWLALDAALEAAKNAPIEQKDSGPAPDSGRYSRQSSTSKDEEKPGNEEEQSEEVVEEEKNEYECVVS